jgi:hypothetical protein
MTLGFTAKSAKDAKEKEFTAKGAKLAKKIWNAIDLRRSNCA